MVSYCRRHPQVPIRSITRHMLGLYHGMPRARLWRRMLSDAGLLSRNRPELLLQAMEAVDASTVMA
jgi:tRNA-dihydrouridine synthase A